MNPSVPGSTPQASSPPEAARRTVLVLLSVRRAFLVPLFQLPAVSPNCQRVTTVKLGEYTVSLIGVDAQTIHPNKPVVSRNSLIPWCRRRESNPHAL